MDRSLGMDEASPSSQAAAIADVVTAYAAGQKKIHRVDQQQHRQHQGAPQQQLSSSPERESGFELERRGSNESASRRRPSHSGSGFLGTMR
ncbi:hypothetical protein TASIC1_0013020100 [Trichoderma asperellum]|uniref:Uncharacterized protein n=1 Tax=Trichoderma asperellum TaxID=101201 RepID=A0A6V8R5V5_TRIAP|nr:hypothetical protein TASIC1_0013020100 [Trichoderma asperellum]